MQYRIKGLIVTSLQRRHQFRRKRVITGMNMIVAVDRNWAIGNKNELLIRIPADHKMFRQETLNKVVVLGRKTLETFPNGLPLAQRTNIILSRQNDYQVKDAVVVHSVEELLEELKQYAADEVYIIGGESVYRTMLPYADIVHVTKIDRAYEADAFFPDLDADAEWEITAQSEEQVYFDTTYTFTKYERRKDGGSR